MNLRGEISPQQIKFRRFQIPSPLWRARKFENDLEPSRSNGHKWDHESRSGQLCIENPMTMTGWRYGLEILATPARQEALKMPASVQL